MFVLVLLLGSVCLLLSVPSKKMPMFSVNSHLCASVEGSGRLHMTAAGVEIVLKSLMGVMRNNSIGLGRQREL
jgi:hypothetical protein